MAFFPVVLEPDGWSSFEPLVLCRSKLLNGMAESKTRRRHLKARLQEVREEHAMQAAELESTADEER